MPRPPRRSRATNPATVPEKMPGRTGRRPLPTAIKRAHGERRQSRLNPREPAPQPGEPTQPPGLGPVAAAEWARLVNLATGMKVLTVADGPALAAVCFAFEDLVEARAVIAKEGRFY